MTIANSDAHSNPGAPHKGTGPKWPRHPTSGHWKLPNGVAADDTPTEISRSELDRLGIEGAHTKPRNEIVQAYAAMLKRVHDDAGSKAVNDWLDKHRS